jgi:hypothetical protein
LKAGWMRVWDFKNEVSKKSKKRGFKKRYDKISDTYWK